MVDNIDTVLLRVSLLRVDSAANSCCCCCCILPVVTAVSLMSKNTLTRQRHCHNWAIISLSVVPAILGGGEIYSIIVSSWFKQSRLDLTFTSVCFRLLCSPPWMGPFYALHFVRLSVFSVRVVQRKKDVESSRLRVTELQLVSVTWTSIPLFCIDRSVSRSINRPVDSVPCMHAA